MMTGGPWKVQGYSSGASTYAYHLTFDESVSRDCWSSGSGAIFWIRSSSGIKTVASGKYLMVGVGSGF